MKSRKGAATGPDVASSPAKPPAVALAAKIALTSLGGNIENLFQVHPQECSPCGRAPVERACDSLVELLESGVLSKPIIELSEESLTDYFSQNSKTEHSDNESNDSFSPVQDSRLPKNQAWLHSNYRSLHDIGCLPFSQTDLWQLHQYFFSPPDIGSLDVALPSSDWRASSTDYDVPSNDTCAVGTEPSKLPPANLTAKRPSSSCDFRDSSVEPVLKRPRRLKTRFAYFPRSMVSQICVLQYSATLILWLSFVRRSLLRYETNQSRVHYHFCGSCDTWNTHSSAAKFLTPSLTPGPTHLTATLTPYC